MRKPIFEYIGENMKRFGKYPESFTFLTTNEYEIAGPDFERDYDGECRKCSGTDLIEMGHSHIGSWVECLECGDTWDVSESDYATH